jgi:hypothetical protein
MSMLEEYLSMGLKKQFSSFSSSDDNLRTPWKLNFLISCVGVFIVIAMVYGFYLGNQMVVKYTPLVDAAMEIKLEATTAHLWFEEVVSGDRSEDIDLVRGHLDQAQWYATAMLEGGENAEGTFLPLDDPVLISEVEKVYEKITIFRTITDQRYQSIQESGTGTQIDQLYDAIFRDFIEQADRVESKLQAEIALEVQVFNIIQTSLIIITVLLLSAIAVFIHRFERRRTSDIQLINQTNITLQKALQEVKKLHGIIPICSYCKKIRDKEGLWNQLEMYIHEHSEAEFSHSACPDCYEKQMTMIKKGN